MLESNVEPDVETFSMLVGSTLFDHNSERAIYYLENMAQFKVAPTRSLFSVLHSVFSADGKKSLANAAAELAKNENVTAEDVAAFVKQAKNTL